MLESAQNFYAFLLYFSVILGAEAVLVAGYQIIEKKRTYKQYLLAASGIVLILVVLASLG